MAVIVVALFAMAAFQISDAAKGYTFDYSTSDYLYDAEHGRYGGLYETAVSDTGEKDSYSTEVSEYRALAFYYEQAVLEHAYRQAGLDEQADRFEARMTEYEATLGSMAGKAASVRACVEAADKSVQ